MEGVNLGSIVNSQSQVDIGSGAIIGTDPQVGVVASKTSRAGVFHHLAVSDGRQSGFVESEQGIEAGRTQAHVINHVHSPKQCGGDHAPPLQATDCC
jgi:hypothetical protein